MSSRMPSRHGAVQPDDVMGRRDPREQEPGPSGAPGCRRSGRDRAPVQVRPHEWATDGGRARSVPPAVLMPPRKEACAGASLPEPEARKEKAGPLAGTGLASASEEGGRGMVLSPGTARPVPVAGRACQAAGPRQRQEAPPSGRPPLADVQQGPVAAQLQLADDEALVFGGPCQGRSASGCAAYLPAAGSLPRSPAIHCRQASSRACQRVRHRRKAGRSPYQSSCLAVRKKRRTAGTSASRRAIRAEPCGPDAGRPQDHPCTRARPPERRAHRHRDVPLRAHAVT